MDRKKYLHLCISWFVVLLLLQVVIPGCSRNILTIFHSNNLDFIGKLYALNPNLQIGRQEFL